MKKIAIISILLFMIILSTSTCLAQENTLIKSVSPEDKATVNSKTPTLSVEFHEEVKIDEKTIILEIGIAKINMLDAEDPEQFTFDGQVFTYTPTEIWSFKNKQNYTISFYVEDFSGNSDQISWEIFIDLAYRDARQSELDIFAIITYIFYGLILGLIAFIIIIIYLKITRKFTFEKYFAQHPMQKNYLVIYLPLAIAVFFTLINLAYITDTTEELPIYSFEYVLILGLLIGITPFAIESQLEKIRIQKYERAFAQLLFEMADAMRGGLDPAKAIIELSKTESGILIYQLKRAAEAIKIGRPFDEVIQIMVSKLKSSLISRYAKLIAEASKVGGDASQVIYRAAKDMDDFIKVTMERRRQLHIQIVTIYIGFIVLLIIIWLLLAMFPDLGSMDLSLLGSSSLEDAATTDSYERMSPLVMRQRFLHAVLINCIGTGLVIGGFTEGKVKYGLGHIIILIIVAIIFFTAMMS
jgi:pilus assembly protein TadC